MRKHLIYVGRCLRNYWVKMVELYEVRKKDIEDTGILRYIVGSSTPKNIGKKGMLWR